MICNSYATTLSRKQIWDKAFTELVSLKFTGEKAELRCYTFWEALCTYRKKIRKYKLNPLYKDEWSRIERIALRRTSRTSFILYREPVYRFENKRYKYISKLPQNSLIFPTSVTRLR